MSKKYGISVLDKINWKISIANEQLESSSKHAALESVFRKLKRENKVPIFNTLNYQKFEVKNMFKTDELFTKAAEIMADKNKFIAIVCNYDNKTTKFYVVSLYTI